MNLKSVTLFSTLLLVACEPHVERSTNYLSPDTEYTAKAEILNFSALDPEVSVVSVAKTDGRFVEVLRVSDATEINVTWKDQRSILIERKGGRVFRFVRLVCFGMPWDRQCIKVEMKLV